MSTAVQTELRLIAIIKEAKELLSMMKEKQIELAATVQNTPKKSDIHKAAIEMRADVLCLISRLKSGVQEAVIVSERMSKHETWKFTVLNVFGEDGLKQCYAYMQEYKNRSAITENQEASVM